MLKVNELLCARLEHEECFRSV